MHPAAQGCDAHQRDYRRWIDIAVADNRPGVPVSIAGRIFDPFLTTSRWVSARVWAFQHAGLGRDHLLHHPEENQPAPLARHLVLISGNVLHRDWDRLKSTLARPVIENPFDPQQIRDAALLMLGERA